jgi:hypothetical protein
MSNRYFYFEAQANHEHCRVCNAKLHAAASKAIGVCRVCAQKSQQSPKVGTRHLRRGK